MNVVIFKFNHLGDNVVFVPVVQALRRLHPDWNLTLLTTPGEAALYGGPYAPQRICTYSKHGFDKAYRRPWVLARWLLRVRAAQPDACLISFDQATMAHLIAKHSGARVRVGGNLQHIRVAGSLTTEVALPADACPASWHWEMARALAGALGTQSDWPDTAPAPDLSHLAGPAGGEPPTRRRIVVHAGASRYLNQWPRERFAAVASSLARDHEVVWITHGGTTGEAPAGTLPAPVKTLHELASWIAPSSLFLGNNSGPIHLANALGCPGVVVTGPSAPGWNPYWHRDRWTVLRHPNLACSPCERPNKALEGCANVESPMACLAYWTPERVEVACRSRLLTAQGGNL